MKKIIISLTAGLVIGYSASMAISNSEVEKWQDQSVRAQQQVVKLSEQLLIEQTQSKQPKQVPRLAQRTLPKSKVLTNGSLNRSSRNKEQILVQRKQAMERMRTQQRNIQKNIPEQDKNQVKTLDNGTVL
ncbi:hypothetical protein AADZ86_18970 [Colwelliaceae bacterium BS250]